MTMRRFLPGLVLFASLTSAGSALAALSPVWADVPDGPMRWLMTDGEKRAWRSVASDEEAERFVQQFWARRDPSAGTPRNEFKEEFDRRVAVADEAFRFRNKRGSLSDQGRVFILLGPPPNFISVATNKLMSIDGTTDPASLRSMADLGNKAFFDYGPATRRIGLTGIVHFVENSSTHEFKVDYSQSNVSGALNQAVKRAIVDSNS